MQTRISLFVSRLHLINIYLLPLIFQKCIDALWDQLKFFQRCLQSKNEQDSVDGLVMLIDATYEELITEGSGLEELRKIKYK